MLTLPKTSCVPRTFSMAKILSTTPFCRGKTSLAPLSVCSRPSPLTATAPFFGVVFCCFFLFFYRSSSALHRQSSTEILPDCWGTFGAGICPMSQNHVTTPPDIQYRLFKQASPCFTYPCNSLHKAFLHIIDWYSNTNQRHPVLIRSGFY